MRLEWMNLHSGSLWELKRSQWVCCSHGLAVRGFGLLVTFGEIKKIFGGLRQADKKPLPVDQDDTRTLII